MSKKNIKSNKNTKRSNYNKRDDRRERDRNSGSKEQELEMSQDGNCVKHAGKTDNDPKWYMKNEQLFRDVASYYISQPIGTKLTWGDNSNVSFGFKEVNANERVIPGVMALHWVPSVGKISVHNDQGGSYFNADTITLASKDTFNFTVHANSRNVDYESADIGMVVMAADSVFNIIAAMVRIYGVATVYDQQNKYLGDALLTAMGIDGDALHDYGLADFRTAINDLIARASTIWIPDKFDVIKRHYWLNSLVYSDSNDATAQLYLYKQDIFFQWSPKTSTQGSQLVPLDFHDVKTPTQWISTAKSMINAIMFDTDPQTMMGDFLKAYGAENIFSLQPIAENYLVVPTFNEEVLLQIHNTQFIVMTSDQRKSLTISQLVDTQDIVQTVSSGSPDFLLPYTFPGASYIDFPNSWKPTAENVMVATRNKTVLQLNYDQTLGVYYSYITGSELFIEAAIYQYDENHELQTVGATNVIPVSETTGMDFDSVLTLSKAAKFDYAPMFYLVTRSGNNGTSTWKLQGVVGDVNHGCVLSNDDLTRLHDVALMSEWNVPNMKH